MTTRDEIGEQKPPQMILAATPPPTDPLAAQVAAVIATAKRRWSRDDSGTETQDDAIAAAVIALLSPASGAVTVRLRQDQADWLHGFLSNSLPRIPAEEAVMDHIVAALDAADAPGAA